MRKCLLTTCALLMSCQFAFAETAEDVLKKIAEQTKKHKTIQYKMKQTANLEQMGQGAKTETNGNYTYLRKDEKTYVHADMTTNMDAGMMKTTSKSKMVVDGEFMWVHTDSVTEVNGQKMPQETVMKNKIDNKLLDPASMENMKNYELKLLPEEKISGNEAWVIEGTPKDAAMKAQQGRVVSWYDKKTGLPLKMAVYTPDGKALSTTTFSDIKVDEKVSPGMFKFEPPAGVQVMDMTKQGG